MKIKKQQPEYATIVELLKRTCEGRENQILFISEGKPEEKIDYKQWRKDLWEIAGKIQALEAKHIGLVCDLTYDCIRCLYAIVVAGKVVVPLEADQLAESLDQYVKRADIDLLLYHEDRVDGEVTACPAMELSDFLALPGDALTEWPVWEGDRSASIFFTSGTEGTPHGVVLTQKNLSYINSYGGVYDIGRAPKVIHFLPMHHVFAFFALTGYLYDGCEIYISKSIKYLSEEMERIKPDLLLTVPILNEIFRYRITKGISDSGMKEKVDGLIRFSNGLLKLGLDLRTPLFHKLRESFGGVPQLIISGGSAVSEETVKFFEEIGITVLQAYGMTEASGCISTNFFDRNKKGTVGHVLWYNEVRIKDSEIQVRGDNIMKEYYKNPVATEAAFDEGWFKTGDLGYFDKDGFLHINGRKKNLIILDNGENVSPEELEKYLLRCPYIGEAVVSEKNNHLHAEIFGNVLSEIDIQEMKKIIEECIHKWNYRNPVYKRIASWELRKEPFEKTSSLKIRR